MLPDLSDVVFGHTTWDLFVSAAPRIFKRYTFPLIRNGATAEKYDMYFSSSPGLLSSVDDFYVTQIGRAHVRTPVTNERLVCRRPLEKQNTHAHTTMHSEPS